MAIITEEQDQPQRPNQSHSETRPPKVQKPISPPSSKSSTPNPFTFWFYFTLLVSLTTLFLISLSYLAPRQDPKSWFLSLPHNLRQHFSEGRIVKVQTSPNQAPIEVFTTEHGPVGAENVLLVHGLGLSSYSFRKVLSMLASKGIHVVAVDLPGNGFSEKSVVEVVEGGNGVFGRLLDVYDEIQEKGLFWAFDRMIETGQIPYEEIGNRVSKRKVVRPIELSPGDIARVLGQVVETMGLAPVHLVLHDSGLGYSANWVSENPALLRSVTLVDTDSKAIGALPLWVLEVPVIREVVLGFSFAYAQLINICCSRGIAVLDAEAHRVLLRGRNGRQAVVGMGTKLNKSFDLAEWGGSDGLKDIPMQVLWSGGWSKEWSEEGRRVADALPLAVFVTHSGGRWPQEDAADKLAESIVQFVSSLPKSIRIVEEEQIPEHIQKMFDEAKSTDHHHHHHHGHGGQEHHDSHAHVHGADAGYMEAYGLGNGW
ncbi:Protein AUXIN RESPONSE 4 [Morella rubra]|uniref:Protein AUXIN RESPONSE 4 n=1 Tax=Morella rubra TaxID=262757 RepID=A0A6A1WTM7_9ROSI|nr:Protein AUXIN RESPONSE 4 [Morella rubra]